MKEWIGKKKVKVFVRNLTGERPIIYTADILSVEDRFITFTDKKGEKVSININDIIQIKEDSEHDEYKPSFYQP